ncbi:MAG TPA: serine hydrolase domain-containing protein [Gaiella sp.]
MQPPDRLGERLERLVATAQAERRSPSIAAAVFRDGETIWRTALGRADVAKDEAASVDHAYRVGSITKTFTAACVLQLRDEGRLELRDPLNAYVDEAPAGVTVADALAHVGGLQREPPGEVWERLESPTREELLAGLADAEQVLRPGESWHYSNLAYGLLGEIVARLDDTTYEDALRLRLLERLGLEQTGFEPSGPRATGYYVDPYSDGVTVEPPLVARRPIAALGWLWSTVDDLCRWADFLVTGKDGVLRRETLDEMAQVRVVSEQATWSLGWGLGLQLWRRGERVFAGHEGAMPGFLTAFTVHRPERTGAVVLCNSGAGARPETLAMDLTEASLSAHPRTPAPWRADAGAPDEVAGLLGRWWVEGSELVLSWKSGRLHLALVQGPPGRDTAWLVAEADDRWRVVEGHELGELLRVVRDEAGRPVKLYLATYPLTRAPAAFADTASE